MVERKNKKALAFVFGLLFVLNAVAWTQVFDLNRSRALEVVFFDVGQGDAIFIQTPQNHQILIDGGPSPVILEKLSKEMPFYDRTIDLIILTHPDQDHLFGLLEVLKSYKVENILWTGVVRDAAEWREWSELIKEEKAEIKIAKAGQRIILQEKPFISLDILYPFESLEGKEFKNSNDTSIVAKLVFISDSFLFTGDITGKTERELVKSGLEISSDVLKVAHHGSKTSTSQEFLEMVLPKIAVIQAGKDNPYGHPDESVLARLEEFGINVLITKEQGDIRIISNGNNF